MGAPPLASSFGIGLPDPGLADDQLTTRRSGKSGWSIGAPVGRSAVRWPKSGEVAAAAEREVLVAAQDVLARVELLESRQP